MQKKEIEKIYTSKIKIYTSGGGDIDVSGNIDMSGTIIASNVKGQYMYLSNLDGGWNNPSLNLLEYGSGPCILGKGTTEAAGGTGTWKNKVFSNLDPSLTNDGFAVTDATGHMTIPQNADGTGPLRIIDSLGPQPPQA